MTYTDQQRVDRAVAARTSNLAYLRTQDARKLAGIVGDVLIGLLDRFPLSTGKRRSAHRVEVAVALVVMVLHAPGGVLEAGIPTIADRAGVSERTTIRASGWLRNLCRVLNRPYRGTPGNGVNKYLLPPSVVRDIAERCRAHGRAAASAALAAKRNRDKRRSPVCDTKSLEVPAPPSPGVVVGSSGRVDPVEATRRRLSVLLFGSPDDCPHGVLPSRCAFCKRATRE